MNETYTFPLGATVVDTRTGERVVFKGENWDASVLVIGHAGQTETENVKAAWIVSTEEWDARIAARKVRVKWNTIPVTDVKVGDTLVIQDALIKADGSHKHYITGRRASSHFVWLTRQDGKVLRYRVSEMVCFGTRF